MTANQALKITQDASIAATYLVEECLAEAMTAIRAAARRQHRKVSNPVSGASPSLQNAVYDRLASEEYGFSVICYKTVGFENHWDVSW